MSVLFDVLYYGFIGYTATDYHISMRNKNDNIKDILHKAKSNLLEFVDGKLPGYIDDDKLAALRGNLSDTPVIKEDFIKEVKGDIEKLFDQKWFYNRLDEKGINYSTIGNQEAYDEFRDGYNERIRSIEDKIVKSTSMSSGEKKELGDILRTASVSHSDHMRLMKNDISLFNLPVVGLSLGLGMMGFIKGLKGAAKSDKSLGEKIGDISTLILGTGLLLLTASKGMQDKVIQNMPESVQKFFTSPTTNSVAP